MDTGFRNRSGSNKESRAVHQTWAGWVPVPTGSSHCKILVIIKRHGLGEPLVKLTPGNVRFREKLGNPMGFLLFPVLEDVALRIRIDVKGCRKVVFVHGTENLVRL